MKPTWWFVSGVLFTVVCATVGGHIFLGTVAGFSAREKPSGLEAWLARAAHNMAIPLAAKQQINPVAATDEVIAQGLAHWADHCASCHANNGSGDTPMGRGMYPPAPDMRLPATQQLSDGELFYIIENGVRLTGMPAWGSGHDGTDSWKLVRFIRHLPNLTFEERREMERLNPKGPDEIEEERQQEEFLKGESNE
jgi:mono/diheme cytochrome c family protein